ncbi:MAG: ABC transporter substrate-binding protein [Deltaproteobacteria bacterium]|nr:ABC transporter substrate-binding protein [Deltaproteobacteria bacterium]
MEKKSMKNRWGVVFVMLAIISVFILSTSATAESPQRGGVLKIISRLSTNTLGTPPEGGWGFSRFARPCYDPIFIPGPDFRPSPGLVESYDVNPDGKTIVFHVRKGVKFHDGTDLNAQAVHWALTHMGGSANYMRKVESFDIVDDHTLRLNMSQFDVNIFTHIQYAGGFVGSPKSFTIEATPEERAKKHMVGAGPFIFDDWERDVFLRYKKNPNYWDKGKPYLDGMEFIWIKDSVTALTAFQAGQGHMIIDLLPKDADILKKKGYTIGTVSIVGPFLAPDGMNADSPFADKRVREAIEYAIDRQAIAEALGYGFWEAANQPAIKGQVCYDPNFKGREYNPATAKKLLSEAGYPKGFETRIIAMHNFSQDALVAMQSYLAEVGIKARLEVIDRGKEAEYNLKGWQNGLLVGGYYSDRLDSLDRNFNIKSTRNHSMYRPEGWQAKLDATIAEVDNAKRVQKTKELLKIIYDTAMNIPLWTNPEIWAMTDQVQGIEYGLYHPYYYLPGSAWLKK